MPQQFVGEIPTIQLKKKAICALGTCGDPIPEGPAVSVGDDLYTHTHCEDNYLFQVNKAGGLFTRSDVVIKYVQDQPD